MRPQTNAEFNDKVIQFPQPVRFPRAVADLRAYQRADIKKLISIVGPDSAMDVIRQITAMG
jgi:hypothetical protein